jgi:hypothetical protein
MIIVPRPLIILFTLAVIATSCRRDLQLASWNVDVLAPIAYGEVNFSDFITSENLVSDNEELIHIIATETLVSLGLDTLIGIPDYSIDTGFVIPLSITFPPGVPFFVQKEDTRLEVKDVELTFGVIRASEIEVFLENTIDKPVLFQYAIYSATLNGDTFFVEERIEANDTMTRKYSLEGYDLDLRGESGTGFNTVVTFIQAMIHPSETENHKFNAGDEFNVKNTVKNIIPEYVEGYFGNQSIRFDEDESVKVFEKLPFKSVNVTEYDMDLFIDNGIGADLKLSINELTSFNGSTSNRVGLSHSIVGSKELFTRAINLYDQNDPVRHIQKAYSFTDENSNLDKLLENRPDRFLFDLSIEVNPLGNVSLGNDFAWYGHNLSAIMKLDLPLIVSVKGAEFTDTTDFVFESGQSANTTKRINSGQLNLYLENGYPFGATVQFYLMDTIGTVIDSLLSMPTTLDGALENQLGVVEESVKSVVAIPVDQELFSNLEEAGLLKTNVQLNTTGLDSIHIRSNSLIGYKLTADLNVATQ